MQIGHNSRCPPISCRTPNFRKGRVEERRGSV
jgi:hypothetical protein